MDIKVKNLKKSQVEITIEFTQEDIAIHQKSACERISQNVDVPGFRKGKAPFEALVKRVGAELIERETRDIAMQKAFVKAATDNDIHPITRPDVKVEKEEPFTVVITVGVMPEVKIDGYEKIKVPTPEIKVEDKEIKEVLDHIQKRNATFAEVDRAAKKGDRVELDFEGFDEKGVSLDSTKSKNHPVVIGDGMFVPGFEDEITGIKKDEEREFTITFPKDYHRKSFQNKKVTFKVQAKMIEERTMPEWNEELVEKASGKKQSIDEFKKEIKADLVKAKTNEETEKRKNNYLDELVKITKIEVPEQLIEEELHATIKDLKHNVTQRGGTWEKYLEITGKTEEEIQKEKREEAEKRVIMRFALRELFKAEKITCTDEEIEHEVKHIMSHYPAEQNKEIQNFYKKGSAGWDQLASKILMDKLFAKVLA